ncbi:MAG: NAD(P)/FAD-dependent oxidoreductase [Chthoniobacterales bacterium]
MSNEYQVIVIGSGSAGKDAALLAAREGLRTLLVEEGRLGGTGVHRGCHAVRALRACATHYERVEESHLLGTYPDLIETNWSSWLNVQSRVTNRMATELSRALDRASVDVRFGRGELFDSHTVVINDDTRKRENITGDNIILATGSRPSFPGNEKARVLNSDQFLQNTLTPQNLLVIGGGYIGCELAAIYRARKVEVKLVEAESRLLPGWDKDIGKRMLKVLDEAGIEVLLNEQVPLPDATSNDPPHFKLRGIISSPDLTLVAVGRAPNVETLSLEKVGLPNSGFISVNAQMQTKVPTIYAIGDVNGVLQLDSAAYAQARVAVQTILGQAARFDAHWIPRCLHTQPPIAAAGWTAAEADAAGHAVEVISQTLSLVTDDDASIVVPDENVLKLVIQSSTGIIMGALAFGSRAPELINLASTAIRTGLTVHSLADLSLIHPSASEAMIRVLQERFDRERRI